jgi:GNAT superfamily N-acetyltransferase
METMLNTSKGEFTLRSARVTDAPAFRDLRLEALKKHPESFSSDYAANLAFPSTFWEQRLNDLGQAGTVFFAVHAGDLIGMCGIHRESSPKVQHTATIWGVYVKEDWRGLGITEGLISRCTGWAIEKGVKVVKLAVVTTNTPAIKAYTRCGFSVYGVEPMAICINDTMYDEMLMVLMI